MSESLTDGDEKATILAIFQEADVHKTGKITQNKLLKLLKLLGVSDSKVKAASQAIQFEEGKIVQYDAFLNYLFSDTTHDMQDKTQENSYHMDVTCFGGHTMTVIAAATTESEGSGWQCHGRYWFGGCRCGATESGHFWDQVRYKCEVCDYDLCGACHDAIAKEAVLDGHWNRGSIFGRKLAWNAGGTDCVDRDGFKSLHLTCKGKTYSGMLQQNGQLHWSDGDIWFKDTRQLPKGWQAAWAEDEGRYYYWCRDRDISVWTRSEIAEQ
jgi:hypothetical protein